MPDGFSFSKFSGCSTSNVQSSNRFHQSYASRASRTACSSAIFSDWSSEILKIVKGSSRRDGNMALEKAILDAIDANGREKRLDNSKTVISLVEQLEKLEKEKPSGIARPAVSTQVLGRWKLIHTTNANTASPIQRKAVDSTNFNIYQDILLTLVDETSRLVVSQVVQFTPSIFLQVDALASTSLYPLPELTERKGDGKVLGLNILGVSLTGSEAEEDIDRPDSRIYFVFDEGNFYIHGFKIPYPVPFRSPWFRDAVKGWIDITYMSPRMRISRGNKGTTFILVKENQTP
jgi:hypothetical protein